jgi:hypothetical protein
LLQQALKIAPVFGSHRRWFGDASQRLEAQHALLCVIETTCVPLGQSPHVAPPAGALVSQRLWFGSDDTQPPLAQQSRLKRNPVRCVPLGHEPQTCDCTASTVSAVPPSASLSRSIGAHAPSSNAAAENAVINPRSIGWRNIVISLSGGHVANRDGRVG